MPPRHILLDLRELADIGTSILLADKAELIPQIDGTSRSSAVHIAAGILSERLGITTDEAMIRLRALAYGQGRPHLDFASEIILDGPPTT